MTHPEFIQRFDYNPDADQLGEGGFAKVYKAWDNTRNEWVALKIAPVRPTMEIFNLLQEFERVKNFSHSNIAMYLECHRIVFPGMGTYDVALMKYYEDGNLDQYLERHRLSQLQKQELLKGILAGISFLHSQRPFLIHGDLKPANILIVSRAGGKLVPLIADFGISRRGVANQTFVTNRLKAASAQFAAPEQLDGDELRPNIDLWSYGILTAYVWLNGKLPFSDDELNLDRTTGQDMLRQRIRALGMVADVDRIPHPYNEVIRRCLVINPKERIKTSQEVEDIISEKTIIRPDLPVEPIERFKDTSKIDPPPTSNRPYYIAGIVAFMCIGWLLYTRSESAEKLPEKKHLAVVLPNHIELYQRANDQINGRKQDFTKYTVLMDSLLRFSEISSDSVRFYREEAIGKLLQEANSMFTEYKDSTAGCESVANALKLDNKNPKALDMKKMNCTE